MITCAEVREHLLTFGNRDRVPVYQHVSECSACELFAARAMVLERRMQSLARVTVPEAWVDRLLVRSELSAARDVAPRLASVPVVERSSATIGSLLAHAACLLVGLAVAGYSDPSDAPLPGSVRLVFYEKGEGVGGGGGGGGDDGPASSPKTAVSESTERRRGVLAPRVPRSLAFDEMMPVELPDDASAWFTGLWSPDALDVPGIDLDAPGSLPANDVRSSAGERGGTGGGDGTGVGIGLGGGVGDGEGGGQGGGPFRPGAWDVAPVLVSRDPDPAYPKKARELNIHGEVILQILVRVDGSTELVGVLKSLPHCMAVARATALSYRWRPALEDGRPVEAYGVITVRFEMLSTQRE